MNKMISLAAAAALAFGGAAFAQTAESNAKTSTPGAGCTATGNAMSAGNLGGTATNKDCGNTGRTAGTTTTTTTAPATAAAPAPAADTSSSTMSSSSSSSSMGAASTNDTTTSASTGKKTKVARADRG